MLQSGVEPSLNTPFSHEYDGKQLNNVETQDLEQIGVSSALHFGSSGLISTIPAKTLPQPTRKNATMPARKKQAIAIFLR